MVATYFGALNPYFAALNKAVYLMAVGGAAYLVSKVIEAARVLAFKDLGMEAICEFEIKNIPVTVDVQGSSVHKTRPREWQMKIGKIPVVEAARETVRCFSASGRSLASVSTKRTNSRGGVCRCGPLASRFRSRL